MNRKIKIGVVGLGYVGLPLAVEFAKKYITVGYDINARRVNELRSFNDSTLEVSKSNLKEVLTKKQDEIGLYVTDDDKFTENCNFYIITVPTPIDKNQNPVLTPLIKASEYVGNQLKKGDIVIYESTVYPGATEEDCVPILEKYSSLKFNKDFYVGYSPERINPGDKERTVTKIKKVTSGSTQESSIIIDNLYKSVITAGTFLASSIKVAEAAKVIENSQRDINIAFVNELSRIFNLLDIDTTSVLEAASTKWNFLPFKPGLVGGHCIGVDPYYLAQKAINVGYNPEIILAGRRMNDSMGVYVANQVVKLMSKHNIKINDSNLLVLGITFKENCPDIRNTKVIDLIFELKGFGIQIDIYDPWADPNEVQDEYSLKIFNSLNKKKYDGIVLAVKHDQFLELDFNELTKKNSVIYDIKSFLGDKATQRL